MNIGKSSMVANIVALLEMTALPFCVQWQFFAAPSIVAGILWARLSWAYGLDSGCNRKRCGGHFARTCTELADDLRGHRSGCLPRHFERGRTCAALAGMAHPRRTGLSRRRGRKSHRLY